ncbi:hypothetical protein RFI_10331, partial [Reticulomyxa filosa]
MSIDEVLAHWPCRAERYLHQVSYVDGSAFCGWEDDIKINNADAKVKKKKKNMSYMDENGKLVDLFSDKTKKNMRKVFIDMKIKRLSDIDTTEEHFRVKFHYYLTWLATWTDYQDWKKFNHESDGVRQSNTKKKYQKEGKSWIPSWTPFVEYVNAIDVYHQNQISFLFFFYIYKNDYTYREMKNGNISLPYTNKDGDPYSWEVKEEEIGFDPTKGYWIRVQFEADVLFSEELELENFPFD